MENPVYSEHESSEVKTFLVETNLQVDQIDFNAMCNLMWVMHGYASGNTQVSNSGIDQSVYTQLLEKNRVMLDKYPAFKAYLIESAIPYAEWCDGRPHQLQGARIFIKLMEAIK